MSIKRVIWTGLTGLALAALISMAVSKPAVSAHESDSIGPLPDAVRAATDRFRNVNEAIAAGYAQFGGCVSGPEEGAMGVHYVNGTLVGDGELDPDRPEALVYEFKNGRLRLVGVEYIVPADLWNARHPGELPHVMGQLALYVGAPHRYGGGPFYELHVWAWRQNPKGMFVDWNPRVSCTEFSDAAAAHSHAH